jgi:hypothetical protein
MPVNIKSYSIKSLIDPTTWTEGEGSATGFSANGADSENHRFMDTDPFGLQAMIWEARNDSTSNADGGWNSSTFSIDNTKLYRFSVWVNRTVQGNGSFYFGTRGYGSTDGVLYRDNGSNSTNPYFWSTGTPTTVGEWTLVVGHVWPVGSGTGANHTDSGRYTIDGSIVGGITRDFVWRSETTTSAHRTYLYYSTDTTTRQRWVYPRVDIVDGTEPSIDELLASPPGEMEVSFSDARELQYDSIVQDGLVLHLDAATFNTVTGTTWYDVSENNNNGTLTNGPTYNSGNGGYISFDGSNDMVIIPNNTALDTQTPTVEVWVKTNATTQYGFWFEKGIVNTQYSLFQEGTNIQWRQNFSGTITNLSTTTATYMNTSNWFQVVGTYTSGARRLYINGSLVNSDTQTGTISTNSGGMSIGVYGGFSGSRSYYYNGNISIVRVYNRALSPTEIEQNYNVQKGRFGVEAVPYEYLTFTADAAITVTEKRKASEYDLIRTSGTTGWNAHAYSNQAFTAPCTIEFYKIAEASNNGKSFAMIGWNVDPTTNASYDSIDIAAYPYRTSDILIYTNGTHYATGGAWDPEKRFYMTYDTDGNVRLWNGETLLYTYSYGTGKTVYIDTSFYITDETYNRFSEVRVTKKSWNGSKYV